MKANEIITYASAKGMNIEFNAGEDGEKYIGIEWKNNYVWYWFLELMDGDLFFVERFSMRNGTSKRGYNRTAINIEKIIDSSSK